jgi:tryptophan synthase beta chain
MATIDLAMAEMPNKEGHFGEYGGQLLPPHMVKIMNEIGTAYDELSKSEAFQTELAELNADFIGAQVLISWPLA